MKKIVITGSNGFIAKNLRLFLVSNGFNCMGITRNPTKTDEISWNDLELGNTYGNYWIHTAGKAHDRSSDVNESEYSKANLYLTQRVFELFLSDPNSEKLILVVFPPFLNIKIDCLIFVNPNIFCGIEIISVTL